MTRRFIVPVIGLLLLTGVAFVWSWANNNLLAIVDKQLLLVPAAERTIGSDLSYFDSYIGLTVERENGEISRVVYASISPEVELLLTTTAGSPFGRSVTILLQGTGSQTLTAGELPEQAVLAVYKRGGTRPEPLYLLRLK